MPGVLRIYSTEEFYDLLNWMRRDPQAWDNSRAMSEAARWLDEHVMLGTRFNDPVEVAIPAAHVDAIETAVEDLAEVECAHHAEYYTHVASY